MASFEIQWNPFDSEDPGPCIDVILANSQDVIKSGSAIGLEYPAPRPLRALLDTGAGVTVISKQFANHCRLFQTCEGSEISAVGAIHRCGEHAGSISFPGTGLRPFESIRIVSLTFPQERYYACLIGRDILRHWDIKFDGRYKRVTITD